MIGRLSLLADRPTALVLVLILTVTLVHLAIRNLAACIALVIPITGTITVAAGLNPIVCGLIVTIVIDAVILYPVQPASNSWRTNPGTSLRQMLAGLDTRFSLRVF